MAGRGKGDRAAAARQAPTRTMLEAAVVMSGEEAADLALGETHPRTTKRRYQVQWVVTQVVHLQVEIMKEAVVIRTGIITTGEIDPMTREARVRNVVVDMTVGAAGL